MFVPPKLGCNRQPIDAPVEPEGGITIFFLLETAREVIPKLGRNQQCIDALVEPEDSVAISFRLEPSRDVQPNGLLQKVACTKALLKSIEQAYQSRTSDKIKKSRTLLQARSRAKVWKTPCSKSPLATIQAL